MTVSSLRSARALGPHGSPHPSLRVPFPRAKAAAGETPQLPSQQTDGSLCPGSWLPRKPPISFPVGTGYRGFSLLRSITEQVSSSHPLFPKDLPRALSRARIPFQEQRPSRKRGGAVISHPPQHSPGSSWSRTEHLLSPGPGPLLRPLPHAALRGLSLAQHTCALSFLALYSVFVLLWSSGLG